MATKKPKKVPSKVEKKAKPHPDDGKIKKVESKSQGDAIKAAIEKAAKPWADQLVQGQHFPQIGEFTYVRKWYWWKIEYFHPTKKKEVPYKKKDGTQGIRKDSVPCTKRTKGAIPRLRAVQIKPPVGYNPAYPAKKWDIFSRVDIPEEKWPKLLKEAPGRSFPWYHDTIITATKKQRAETVSTGVAIVPDPGNYEIIVKAKGGWVAAETIKGAAQSEDYLFAYADQGKLIRQLWTHPHPFESHYRYAKMMSKKPTERDRITTYYVDGDTMRDCVEKINIGGLGWGSIGCVTVYPAYGTIKSGTGEFTVDGLTKDVITVPFAFVNAKKDTMTIQVREMAQNPEGVLIREIERRLVASMRGKEDNLGDYMEGFRVSSDDFLEEAYDRLIAARDPIYESADIEKLERDLLNRLKDVKIDKIALRVVVQVHQQPLVRYKGKATVKTLGMDQLSWLAGRNGVLYSLQNIKEAVKVYRGLGVKMTEPKLRKQLEDFYAEFSRKLTVPEKEAFEKFFATRKRK